MASKIFFIWWNDVAKKKKNESQEADIETKQRTSALDDK